LSQHEPVGILVGGVYRRIKQVASGRVRHLGLTSQQSLVVVAVFECGGGSLGEIAARIRMDQPTASRIVTTLLKRNLVRADADPSDRRRARLMLTARGTKVAKKLHDLAREVRAATEAGFSAAERATLRGLLHRVIANLDRYERKRSGRRPA